MIPLCVTICLAYDLIFTATAMKQAHALIHYVPSQGHALIKYIMIES